MKPHGHGVLHQLADGGDPGGPCQIQGRVRGKRKPLLFTRTSVHRMWRTRKLEPQAGQVPVGVDGLTRACRRVTVSCDGRSVSSRVGTRGAYVPVGVDELTRACRVKLGNISFPESTRGRRKQFTYRTCNVTPHTRCERRSVCFGARVGVGVSAQAHLLSQRRRTAAGGGKGTCVQVPGPPETGCLTWRVRKTHW